MPTLVADDPLHDLQVPEPPLLEVVLDVDQLLAGLVDAPSARAGAAYTVANRSTSRRRWCAALTSRARPGQEVRRSRASEVAQELVVQRRLVEQLVELRSRAAGSCAKTFTMSASLLPSRNSTSRYCADWKPETGRRNGRISAYSLGVSVASTDHWSVSVCWMCLTRASRLSAGERSSAASSARAERSSWTISFSQSSLVWCWTMKSSSSCCGGSVSGCCADSSTSSRR